MLTITSLGTYTVQFGAADDPNRITRLIGDFPNTLSDLARGYSHGRTIERAFCNDAGSGSWLEGEHRQELLAANFGTYIDHADIQGAISEIPSGFHLAPFPSLATFLRANSSGNIWGGEGGGEQFLIVLEPSSLLPLTGHGVTDMHAPSAKFKPNFMTAWGLRFGLYKHTSILLCR